MKNKKSLLSVLLAAVLLCACVAGMLVFGASAEETPAPTHLVLEVDGKGGNGKYATITAALKSVTSSTDWAPGSTLTVEISTEKCHSESFAKLTDGYTWTPFQTWTKFLSDGSKLPITIKSTYVPEGESEARSSIAFKLENYYSWSLYFTNDYTFENVDFYTKQVQSGTNSDGSAKYRYDKFFAGMGNVTFKNVGFHTWIYNFKEGSTSSWDTTIDGTTYNARGIQFFGDMDSSAFGSSYTVGGIAGAWSTERFDANKGKDGLLKVGFTFENTDYFTAGSNVGSPCPQTWQQSYVSASYGTSYSRANKNGFTLNQNKIHAHITVTGDSVVTRVNGFRTITGATTVCPGKVSLNVNGNATVYGLFADSGNGPGYHSTNVNGIVNYPRKVNVEINVSENATIKGNNSTSSSDNSSITAVADATYTADSKVVINITGGTIERDVVAVGGRGNGSYSMPLNTAGDIEINVSGTALLKKGIYGVSTINDKNINTFTGNIDINLSATVNGAIYDVYGASVNSGDISVLISDGTYKGNVTASKLTINDGSFEGTVTSDNAVVKSAIFYNPVVADNLVFAGGTVALATQYKPEESLHETIHVTDVTGATTVERHSGYIYNHEHIMLTLPAEDADLITLSNNTRGYAWKNIDGDTCKIEAKLWSDEAVQLDLTDRVVAKLYLNKDAMDHADLYAGKTISFTAGAIGINSARELDLSKLPVKKYNNKDYYVVELPALGAGRFGEEITILCNVWNGITFTINGVAQNGAETYASQPAVAALFKALVSYGNSVNGGAVELNVDALNAYAAEKIVPNAARFSITREAETINFTGVTLLMGDTIGIRLKAVNTAGAMVYYDGAPLTANEDYRITDTTIDLYINANNFETILDIVVKDAEGNVCLNMQESVAHLVFSLIQADETAFATNLKLQATAMLVLRVSEYCAALAA